MTRFWQSFDPCWGWEPTVWQSRPIPTVSNKCHNSPHNYRINSASVGHCKVPRFGRSILEGIPEGAVGVRHFANSAVIANGGVKSHWGTTCFQHENKFLGDVTTKFLLAIRTVCSGCCARFPDDETCCTFHGIDFSLVLFTFTLQVWIVGEKYTLEAHRYIKQFR